MDWTTLILQTINFLVLVWLLQRFLYRPVLGVIDARRQRILEAETQARAALTRADQAEKDWRAKERNMEAERVKTARQAEAEAARRTAAAMEEARKQSERLLAEAKRNIVEEQAGAQALLVTQATQVATSLAARLLQQTAPTIGPEPFLVLLEQRLAGMDARALDELEGPPLRLETAPALAEPKRREWASRLTRFFADLDPLDLAVVEKPDLIAGASLVFDGTLLSASWAEALAKALPETSAGSGHGGHA